MTGQLSFTTPAPGSELPAPAGWPDPPDPPAFSGLAGDVVAAVAPHTEADPVAILAQLLVAYGSAIGRGAWFQIDATRHYPNEFVVLVGETARARKGSSWDRVNDLVSTVDLGFGGRIATGLASGDYLR